MDHIKNSCKAWLDELWDNLPVVPDELFNIASSAADLETFRTGGWNAPQEITPQTYMEYMNTKIREYLEGE